MMSSSFFLKQITFHSILQHEKISHRKLRIKLVRKLSAVQYRTVVTKGSKVLTNNFSVNSGQTHDKVSAAVEQVERR